MDKVVTRFKKDIKKVLPMVTRRTKSNQYDSDYHKQVYFNVNDNEIVVIGASDQSMVVVNTPYLNLKEFANENFQLWKEDATLLTKAKSIDEIKNIIKNRGFTNSYRNYKYVIEGFGKCKFTFDTQDFLNKLLQVNDETFSLTITQNSVKINNQSIECKSLEYQEIPVRFTIANKLVTTGLKMMDGEANFIFGHTYVIALTTDSFIYATVAKERYYPEESC
jgi:hypothetical protein